MHSSVLKALRPYSGRAIYFDALGGNNGDNLIELGAREVLANLEIRLADHPLEGDAIVVNGSGDLSYLPRSRAIETTRQARDLADYPDKPLILLPSSTTEFNAERIARIVQRRSAETHLFARDALSLSRLSVHCSANANVEIDHDMAFALLGSDFINTLMTSPSGLSEPVTLLIVERFDEERASELPALYRSPIRRLIPRSVRKALKTRVLPSVHSNTAFAAAAAGKADELFPGMKYDRRVAADISLPQNHTFRDFVSSVVSSTTVVSTRLHVCILATMLGKNVVAVQPHGSDKIEGVFDQSLAGFSTTRLWRVSASARAS